MKEKTLKNSNQPRWEWRIFGDCFPTAESYIRQYPCERVKHSTEIYILSHRSPHNCKIRDGLMDIKNLVRRNEQQLELWRPVLKAGFPLDSELVRLLFRTLRVAQQQDFAGVTLEELLEQVLPQHPELRTLQVTKERYGFTIDETAVELATLKIGTQTLTTIGAEQHDPDKVGAVVRRLGFDPSQNQNYIQALKNLCEWS